jgi:hypothetical protein
MNTNFNSFNTYISNKLSLNIQDWIKITSQILLILIVYFIVHRGLFWLTTLPFEAYYNDFIYVEFLKRIVGKPYLLILLIIGLGYYNKKLFMPWRNFGDTNLIRNFLLIVSLALTWFFSTYGTNFYFNQVHSLDRILLVILFLCSFWKPFFLIPYITVLLTIIGQFESLPVFSIATPPFLLIKIIFLFITFFILKFITKKFDPALFIFMVGCLIATHYITPGIRKFNYYWIFKNQINFLIPSAYANGWLPFLTAKTITNITNFLSWFNIPLKLFTIVIECGMLLFFIHKKWARFLIFGAVIMHLGIFGYTGILFWMWIVILIFASFLFSSKHFNLEKIFNIKYFIISIFIIGGGFIWCQAKSLTWCDTPLSYTYKIYGETADGKRHRLSPNFFSHYDYQITLGMVKFWQKEPRLSIVWGATNTHISNYFNTERTIQEVLEYEKVNGRLLKNDDHQKKYDNFLVQYLTNWNHRSTDFNFTKLIQALPFYWTSPQSSIYNIKEDIIRVVIVESTTFYSVQTGFKEIRNQEIQHLKIPNSNSKP